MVYKSHEIKMIILTTHYMLLTLTTTWHPKVNLNPTSNPIAFWGSSQGELLKNPQGGMENSTIRGLPKKVAPILPWRIHGAGRKMLT